MYGELEEAEAKAGKTKPGRRYLSRGNSTDIAPD